MTTIEIHYNGKRLTPPLEIIDKGLGGKDYVIFDKNGHSFYIFRKQDKDWILAYGQLSNSITQAVIDALIKLTNRFAVCVFWYDGKRRVLEVSSVSGGGGSYHITINNYLVGSIWKTDHFGWRFWMHKDELLNTCDIEVIIEMIEANEIV